MGFNYEDVVFARWFTFCCDHFKEEIITRYITSVTWLFSPPTAQKTGGKTKCKFGTFLISMFHQSRAELEESIMNETCFTSQRLRERCSCGDKTRQHRRRLFVKSLYFSSLITLKQISENYDNKFNSVQLSPHPPETKKQDPTVLLFCISVWLLKWRQCESPVNWEIMRYDKIHKEKTFTNSSLESCVVAFQQWEWNADTMRRQCDDQTRRL